MLLSLVYCGLTAAATSVPTDAQMPGTQPGEVNIGPQNGVARAIDPARQCSFCHSSYNKAVEPGHNWGGSMMSQAGRDPVFWATLAVAEQDFDGAGDVCLRCHTSGAWLAGRSTPTDGSSLVSSHDANGIECDTCHRMTNPDQSEFKGMQNYPFIANNKKTPATGYYGSAQYVMWPGPEKLGPYADAVTKHPSPSSKYHRSPDFCGTCHDVSNPVTGDLAHNNGAQIPLAKGTFSGVPGAPVQSKAAFNNFPYQYGVVERTYSEYKAAVWPTFKVSDYAKLPADLQAGAIALAYTKAQAAGKGGDYEDGTTRYFTCQTCHLSPTTGQASSTLHNSPKDRKDMPLHDLTGGNYWAPQAIKYLDSAGKLRIGGGLSGDQIAAIDDGVARARTNLTNAASLSVTGRKLKVTNLTGHKLISGYPEGRRMWINIKWYNTANAIVREDGQFGPLTVTLDGTQRQVNTLLDLSGRNTKIYEVQGAVTKIWANQLLKMGAPPTLPLSFNRVTGKVDTTLKDLATSKYASYQPTFHFILNNYVASDNRIPPYGMRYADAAARNALPVPFCQYGCPKSSGTFQYYDLLDLNPPRGATRADISLMYQPTSWEYIQFLHLANSRSNPFLANEGANLMDAWLNTGMADPQVMATTTWTCPAGSGGGKGTSTPSSAGGC
jgi:hypothetical protein